MKKFFLTMVFALIGMVAMNAQGLPGFAEATEWDCHYEVVDSYEFGGILFLGPVKYTETTYEVCSNGLGGTRRTVVSSWSIFIVSNEADKHDLENKLEVNPDIFAVDPKTTRVMVG